MWTGADHLPDCAEYAGEQAQEEHRAGVFALLCLLRFARMPRPPLCATAAMAVRRATMDTHVGILSLCLNRLTKEMSKDNHRIFDEMAQLSLSAALYLCWRSDYTVAQVRCSSERGKPCRSGNMRFAKSQTLQNYGKNRLHLVSKDGK